VSGSAQNATDSVQVTSINLGTATNTVNGVALAQNAVSITFTMPSPTMAQDLYSAVVGDPNFDKTGVAVGTSKAACNNAAPAAATVTVCFYL
jgi:hypothetical protein